MSPSMQVWKRVTLSLQGLVPAAEPPSTRPKPRPLQLEHLMARNLLAADPGPAALQYTAGATIPGQVAQPLGFNENDFCVPYGLNLADAAPPAAPLHHHLNEGFSDADSPAASLWGNSSDYGPLAMLQSGFAADPLAYGISGSGTELDSTCAAIEILIALLQGQLQSLLDEQAATNDPTTSAWLQGQINAVYASIIEAQSDLDNMNCGGGSSPGISSGASSDYSSGSGTEGYSSGYTYGSTDGYSAGSSSGYSSGSSSGMSSGSWSGSDGGTTGGYWPSQPGASSGSGGYSTTTGSYGASSGSANSQSGTTWSGSSGPDPWQGSSGQTGGDTMGGTSGGYSGSTAGSYGSSSWASSGYSSGTAGYSGGRSSDGTEPGVYSLSDLRAGTFAYSAATEVGPVHEGQRLQVAARISVPWLADPYQPQPHLIVQADLDFDGQFNDQEETIRITVWHGMEAFEVTFAVRDDGPSPGNGTASDPINVRASLADQTATTSATVLNVAPWFVRAPALTFETNAQGVPVAVVTAEFADPGRLDVHQLDIHWGDGRISSATIDPALPNQQNSFTRSFRVERPLTGNERNLRPVTIVLRDDDTGEAAFHFAALDVRLNNDDDNDNTIPDQQERDVANEDDILELSLSAMTALVPAAAVGNYGFQYDTNTIRVWDSAEKRNLILSSTSWAGPTDGDLPAGIPYTGQATVWVEGVTIHTTAISLSWTDTASPESVEVPRTTPLANIRVTVWGLDLDIDSDNNNGFNFPDNSDWEEYLESSEYGIGKLVYPNATHFTPARLRINRGLDPQDPQIRVRLDFIPVGKSGILHLWNTHRANPNRINRSVDAGGNRLFTGEDYTLAQLNYDPASGGITLFLEGFQASETRATKKGVDTMGKPTDLLSATVIGLNNTSLTDTVQYLIANPDTFYPNLVASQTIRNAMASEGVYQEGALADRPQFGLKALSDDDLRELGVPEEIIELIGTPASIPGFKNALYHDHTSNSYILSFAGTDDVHDVLIDVWQGLGEPTDQYEAAMHIGSRLSELPRLSSRLITTGHSLGGGLASAASVVGDIPAVTFNAAGLLSKTLLDATGVERYRGSLSRYQNAERLINAHYLDFDLLSFVQDKTPLQNAIGLRIEMDGPIDLEIAIGATFLTVKLASGTGWMATFASLGYLGYKMGLAHTTHYYLYGLLVNEQTGWDVYGYTF